MTNTFIKNFFDHLAPDWDGFEECSAQKKLFLLNKIGLKKGASVIDVACGTGAITSLIHDITNSAVIGVDLSSKMISIAKQKYKGLDWATFYHADFLSFSPQQKFDFAVLYNCYPHFSVVSALAEKAYTILNDSGGLAILHSLSRSDLNAHHEMHAQGVSRAILSPSEEGKNFIKYFNIETAEENEQYYLLVLKRK